MTGYIKQPHTVIFTGQTGCGKTHLVLELIEKEYNKNFDYIVIICTTLRENSTYHAKEWMKQMVVFGLQSLKTIWNKKLSELLRLLQVLFIVDDVIANKDLDKRRQPLLKLSISGRHRGQYPRLLTQSYKGIPKQLREQAKAFLFGIQRQRQTFTLYVMKMMR